jgi:hypothetical protein
MAKGRAVLIGLNSVDPDHYDGWSGPLTACEADATSMDAIASSQGLSTTTLLTKHATRANVLKNLRSASRQLNAGDYLLLTYSGHGGQVPDMNGDEDDSVDETWCLFDGQLIDDELSAVFGEFKKGVRIFVLSDSCHSGTVVKMTFADEFAKRSLSPGVVYRNMPLEVARRTYTSNQDFYDKIQASTKPLGKDDIAASVLLISGCQDNQLSADGPFNGLFTSKLLHVWNGGKFSGNYVEFHQKIVGYMPPDQTPNRFWGSEPDAGFLNSRPFMIAAPNTNGKSATKGIAAFVKSPKGGMWQDYTGPDAKTVKVTYKPPKLGELWLQQLGGEKQFARLDLANAQASAGVAPGDYILLFRGKATQPNEEYDLEITAPTEAKWKPKPPATSDANANINGIHSFKVDK